VLRVMTTAAHTPTQHIAWDALRAELHRFVSRRLAGPDAEDVVQEALVRIHRGLPAVREQGAIVGWLYQVTRNTLADHLRASRPSDELTDDHDAGPPIDVDDAAFGRLAACVAPFVAMLADHHRQALELVELRGLSQVEAAATLGIPLSTMKSRVQRGRRELRELLEQCCTIAVDARGHVVEVTPRDRCSCRV
jgi:RNA polymerase sigma-70 factor (ECF subfamily)